MQKTCKRGLLNDLDASFVNLSENAFRFIYRTQLERRFEESRYRLNCALQTVHEYEDEIVKLRRQLAEFETKLEDRSKIESDFAQLREYSQQLEKQFATQSHLIDALKEKIIQVKS